MPSHPHQEGCARLNIARLKAFRLNFYEPLTLAVIGGIDRSRHVRIEGASVQHVLNDQPDTASVRVHGFVPVAGQPFALYDGDTSPDRQLFGGRILETTVLYESLKQNVAYDIQAIDPTWLLNRKRVLASYTNLSATSIVLDMVAKFVPGVTTAHVVAGLPIIDALTFTNETPAACLTAICERIGAYWSLDYSGDLHVFLHEGPDANSITDADANGASDLQLSEDLSQVVTRVIARGGGGQAVVDVAAGATEIPVSDDAWYSTAGGVVEAAAQRVTYTGVRGRGGVGALVGVALSPTSPPFVTAASGPGLPAGTYKYAITFANAVGETLPGPTASVVVGGTAPTLIPTSVRPGYYADYQGKTTGGNYSWAIQLGYAYGGLALGPGTPHTVVNDRRYEIYVGDARRDPVSGYYYYSGLMSGTAAQIDTTFIFRTVDGGNVWYRENFFNGVVSTAGGWLDVSNQMTDADLLAENNPYQTTPIASFNQVRVTDLQTLPATGFTTRKLYRTAVNGSQLKLLVTNPADSFLDVAADATLGANAPTTDTSGVVAGASQTVPPGATNLPVTDRTPFINDGGAGWVTVGNMPLRYTSTDPGVLQGIPATGVGSITAAIRHGAQVLVQPRLIGISGLSRALVAGDPVTIRLEVDDPAAQAALGARLGGTAADGIVEEVFSDSRMTRVELENYGRALLLERKDPRLTLRFVSRHPTVRVGRLIYVNTALPPITGWFRVQSIGFDEIAISGGLGRTQPRRTVEASNKLYTFADLLRRLRGREGGAG